MSNHRTAAYTPPAIRDHGTLAALTADFDLHVAGSVVKLATIAMASAPGGSLIVGGETSSSGPVDPGPPGRTPFAAQAADLLTPEARAAPADPAVLGDQGATDPAGAGGRETGAGVAGAGGATPAAAGGGQLPFTGYPAAIAAAVGAAMTLAGTALRAALRRGRP